MIKANYHTHLVYCKHAEGHAEDYIEEAIKNNFVEIGITDHAPILECFMSDYDYNENWCFQSMKLDIMYSGYLKEVNLAKEKYKGQIKVLTGFETEYIEGNKFFVKKLKSLVDYLNLGVHFFDYDSTVYNSYSQVDYKSIYGYLNACIKGMESNLFNTLVHPDLFMFKYQNINGQRVFDEHCEYVSRKIIESAIKNNVYLEINANGIKNSLKYGVDKDWLYPCYDFWKIAKEYPDLKIIIGADAHTPGALTCSYVEDVIKFAEELGLKIHETMQINK